MAVKLIHKNSGVKNKPVLPSQIEYGEISINWHDSGPFIQVKDASNEIVRVGGVIIQDNQPALAQKGAFWLSGTELYLYNGTAWILISGGGGGGSDFIACTDGGLVFDATDQCWQIDEAWLLEWATNNAPGTVDPGDGELTIVDADGNTLGVFTANQSGDVEIVLPAGDSFSGDYDDLTNKPAAPGDGELLIKDADDNTLGTFTANQTGNVEVVVPAGFSGTWDDIQNKPTIGDGTLTIKDSDGTDVAEFTANQAGDTEVTLPAGFSGDYDDLTNTPAAPGDGLITIKAADGSNVGSFNVNQATPTIINLPSTDLPDSLHPKGFINVDDRAPDTPEHGDIYIQHKDDGTDGQANSTFGPGIPFGTVVPEGSLVIYGADDLWHFGGNINSTIGDGKLTLSTTHSADVVVEFTANQDTDLSIQLPFMPLDIRELQELS